MCVLTDLVCRVFRILEPVRKHFAIPENAALLEQVKSFRVTR